MMPLIQGAVAAKPGLPSRDKPVSRTNLSKDYDHHEKTDEIAALQNLMFCAMFYVYNTKISILQLTHTWI